MNTKQFKRFSAVLPLALALTASVLVTGCAGVAAVTGVAGGAAASTDRRTLGTQTEDRVISLKGEAEASRVGGDNSHINVTSFNRKVLLTGEVPTDAVKQSVANAVRNVENVTSVINELVVGPTQGLASRTNDSYITAKVTSTFFAEDKLRVNSLKTVTENSTVFLMGRVTREEGDLAAKLASTVDGVYKVVKVFDYITQADIDRLNDLNAPVTDKKPAATEAQPGAHTGTPEGASTSQPSTVEVKTYSIK